MDRIRIGYPARYLRFFSYQDWIFIFEKNWIRTGSGYLFYFYNEISLKVIQDVTNDDGSVVFAMVFIFTKKSKLFCQYAVHSPQSMIIRVTLSLFFRRNGSSELLLQCW